MNALVHAEEAPFIVNVQGKIDQAYAAMLRLHGLQSRLQEVSRVANCPCEHAGAATC